MSRPAAATDRLRLLRIYLNDHLMGATLAVRLIRRSLSSNRGGELGALLEDLHTEVAEDKDALKELMDAFGFPVDPVKQVAAVAAERIGLLKLNGSLTGYSDLSRLLELEGLHAGVDAKLRLWRSLRQVASAHPELDPAALDRLIARAESQLQRLEPHRLDAASRTFA